MNDTDLKIIAKRLQFPQKNTNVVKTETPGTKIGTAIGVNQTKQPTH